ncbi:hypothetical protein CLAFUW4_02671 [Fulvia fulva]|uniref:Uncharacterized protein n=1 Tax=Passalora fulva TaxID=5499 RepID=A0A9Q8P5B4_PASFU|nr:uncharacterized protein CLAFUR5_02661 [Fulvia fulva]KAK4632143.1 hypothetical protein CLAFUR4_02666 [Fulvia fulva]UJO13726.1 hypothetical protein CLAFUR5_02661 [Fulvia fulva]WPV11650.1 hypothetical protein CLAFUW4_02671 [Fulvia fulva]WPV26242.1 hypothetical protein CLAFUW7_02670 [Fulvia fulva]
MAGIVEGVLQSLKRTLGRALGKQNPKQGQSNVQDLLPSRNNGTPGQEPAVNTTVGGSTTGSRTVPELRQSEAGSLSGARSSRRQEADTSVQAQNDNSAMPRPDLTAEIVDLEHEGNPRKVLMLTEDVIHQLQSTVHLGREIRDTQGALEARRALVNEYRDYATAEQERQQNIFFEDPIEGNNDRRKRARTKGEFLSARLQEADGDERALDDRLAQLDEKAVNQVRMTAGYLNQVLIRGSLVGTDSVDRHETASDVAFRDRYTVPEASSDVDDNREADAIREDDEAIHNPASQILSEAQIAEREYRQKLLDLERAQTRFDRYQMVRDIEAAAFRQRLEAGQHVHENILDFDLRHYQRGQDLTRELIQAEEQLALAKARAVKLGVSITDDDLSSGFVEDSQDGSMLDAREPRQRVDLPRVLDWAAILPETTDPQNSARGFWDSLYHARGLTVKSEEWPELDAWNPGPELRSSDSASVVAEGHEKRRIEKHRATTTTKSVLDATKAHWGLHNDRGLTAAQWDRGHRMW